MHVFTCVAVLAHVSCVSALWTPASNSRAVAIPRRVLGARTPVAMGASIPASSAQALVGRKKRFAGQTMRRVLSEVTRLKPVPYVRAVTNDPVIDVVGELLEVGRGTAALVFDENGNFAGIFTERDYLRVALSEQEDEAAAIAAAAVGADATSLMLASEVGTFMTPASKIVAADPETTADEALTVMRNKGIRHLVISAAACEGEECALPSGESGAGVGAPGLTDASKLFGVVSVGQIVSLMQQDDKLALKALTLSDGQIEAVPGGYKPTLERIYDRQRERLNEIALEQGEEDLKRTGIAAVVASGVVLALQGQFLHEHWQSAMWFTFALGYIGIIFEEVFEFNKAGIGLLMSGIMWVIYSDYSGVAMPEVLGQLTEKLAEVSDICFFILAASTIVEVMDAHQGFKVVTTLLETDKKKELFVSISVLTFFLSAILNNLTVTIVMVSLLRKLVPSKDERLLFGAMVVCASNAGGVWTPIGDVTTTMLWINDNLSTLPIVLNLLLPSLASLVVCTAVLLPQVVEDDPKDPSAVPRIVPAEAPIAPRGNIVFGTGIGALLFVPVFNELTGLPPYLGMLGGLGALWLLTDIIHAGEELASLKVPSALGKLDTSGILFFFGILLSVGALESSGLLKTLAVQLSDSIGNLDVIAAVIGLASAVVDNVPLVAATMGMYSLDQYATDDQLWQLIAYCAGTGGSILVIGSASGVALMGLEKVEFLWYLKKVSLGAFAGYVAGIAVYLAQHELLGTLGVTTGAVATLGS